MPFSKTKLLFIISSLLLCACQEPTEREQAEKLARKQGDDRQLMLIEEVHKILDAPAPTQDQIDTLVKNALSNMVRIEGGEFTMGVNPERMGGDWDGWKPVDGRRQSASIHESAFFEHPVRLSTYYISKFETTYAEFDAFKKATGRDIRFEEDLIGSRYKGYSGYVHDCCRAPNKPAAADWYEAKDYCEWLGEQSGLPITLPTEAQWEYAARERGKWLMFATKWGGVGSLTNRTSKATTEVDALSHSMNDLGLYFMSGNLSEWVLDWYDPDYYQKSPLQDPVNEVPVQAYIRHGVYEHAKVHRGGHQFLDNSLGDSRNVFNRFYAEPERYSFGSVGIRCAINSEKAL
ncbi:formylglycine-generating enzyme family protein [Reinekea blandensis]|nr:formylglycine-generating enzyme family protein [Reinekea blandensis]